MLQFFFENMAQIERKIALTGGSSLIELTYEVCGYNRHRGHEYTRCSH